MPATVILNPYANRWEAGKQQPEVESCLTKAGIDYVLHRTEGSGHGIELARQAVETGATPLIAAGGDGTFSEVLNGLFQGTPGTAYPAGPLGLLPLGTANDLTDSLGMPREIEEAVSIIAEGNTRQIDVGKVNGRFFDNNSAIGLEPMVSIANIRLTWLRGVTRYLVAAVLTILKRPSWEGELIWDGGSYEGSLTLVSVGNTNRTGGVFYMTPNAVVDDGMLDFVYAPALGRLRLLQLLPKAQTGDHIKEAEVKEERTKLLTIRTVKPTPIQADGELIDYRATEVRYEVVPRALRIFSPDG